jgi:hypothetical protein
LGKGVQNLATNVRHDRLESMVTGGLTALRAVQKWSGG